MRKPDEVEDAMSLKNLAAGLGNLRRVEVSDASNGVYGTPVLTQPARFCDLKVTDNSTDSEEDLSSPVSSCGSTNTVLYNKTSTAYRNSFHEMVNKRDHYLENVYGFYRPLNILEDQQTASVPTVSKLHSELQRAYNRINDLENEQRSSKKKHDLFLRKLAEEKSSWHTCVLEKIHVIINDMKEELNNETKNRKRLEVINYKLECELEEAKLSAKRHLLYYEKERKSRKHIEEVGYDLAKLIVEERVELEALRKHSMKMSDEFAVERRMLKTVNAWREERVQLKLRDIMLTLKDKYTQMQHLQGELEVFLRTNAGRNPTGVEIQKAEMLRDAVDMVNIQELKEFDGLSRNPMGTPSAKTNSSDDEEDSEDDSGSETSSLGEEIYFSRSLDVENNAAKEDHQ